MLKKQIGVFILILMLTLVGAGCRPASSDRPEREGLEDNQSASGISYEETTENTEETETSVTGFETEAGIREEMPSFRDEQGMGAAGSGLTDAPAGTEAGGAAVPSAPSSSAVSGQGIEPSRTPASTSAASPAPPTESPEAPAQIQVTISVNWENAVAANNQIALAVAPDGVVLPATGVTLEQGESVFDALLETGLVVSYQKSLYSVYVSGIQSLSEKACGGGSGWIYKVNGTVASIGCSGYILQDGDVIEWVYTCDSGKDVH